MGHDLMVGLTGPVAAAGKAYRRAWAHAGPLGDFAYAGFRSSNPAVSPQKPDARRH